MLERKLLEAAATWYVQLSATPDSERHRLAWQHWLEQDEKHALAWAQVERLQQRFAVLSPELALPTLAGVRARRRAVAKVLGVLLAAGAAGLGALTLEPWPSRMAQYRTAKGQRRSLQLADGSQLHINTDSAVDIHFSAELREIHLHRGELLIQTAADPALRPLLVHAPQGSVRALGTRFSVYSQGDRCEVRVFEHAVEIRPAAAPMRIQRISAGQQANFDQQTAAPPVPLVGTSDAWVEGMLIAPDWPLAVLLREVSRYRPGYLTCSEAVAGLRVTGAFRVDDTDTVLENLATALPIRVRSLTRYWVRIDAA